MNVPAVLLWGGVATMVLSGTMYAALELGLSRMSLPLLLGSAFTMDRRRAIILGLLLHLIGGWLFAAVYALGFESLSRASWWLGAIGGVVHAGLLLTVGMIVLVSLHPHMATPEQGPTPTRWLQPPGFLALNYGRRTPLVAVAAHALYGAILGATYHLVQPRSHAWISATDRPAPASIVSQDRSRPPIPDDPVTIRGVAVWTDRGPAVLLLHHAGPRHPQPDRRPRRPDPRIADAGLRGTRSPDPIPVD